MQVIDSYLSQLDPERKGAIELLRRLNQEHLFKNWKDGEQTKVEKFCDQVLQLDKKYPGGLEAYIASARKLLADSAAGVNPFEGKRPEVPAGEVVETGSELYYNMEAVGMEAVDRTGYVLVAGGLGERLGYHGIKIALPVDLVTGKTYIQLYIEHILAFQERSRKRLGDNSIILPLAIMTSDDTHNKTVDLLHKHDNFGMAPGQITLVKQEKVPSLMNRDGKFCTMEDDPYTINTKPHGHGDVHSLLHMEGVVSKWLDMGIKHVVFFQDTNALVFHAIPVALGISVTDGFIINSICVPRRAGEAAGGICRLVSESNPSVEMTINVEYNQLDPLLRATVNPAGDVGNEDGLSPYPGNINALIFALQPYAKVLEKTGGQIPEFVNPKYADEKKEKFQKPTRLECMMQDFPRLLQDDPDAKVGFSQFDRWICFSAVKNNTTDAAAKVAKKLPPECAATGEQDFYRCQAKLLKLLGINVDYADILTYLGIPVSLGPALHLAPSFACSLAELRKKFQFGSISSRSCLVVEGDVEIQSLELDGTLVVRACPGSKVVIKSLKVTNSGWSFKSLADSDSPATEEFIAIRGYNLSRSQADIREIVVSRPGRTLVVDGDVESLK